MHTAVALQFKLIRSFFPGVIMLISASVAMAQVPIIQPGTPGDPARELSAEEATRIADTSFSPADARSGPRYICVGRVPGRNLRYRLH